MTEFAALIVVPSLVAYLLGCLISFLIHWVWGNKTLLIDKHHKHYIGTDEEKEIYEKRKQAYEKRVYESMNCAFIKFVNKKRKQWIKYFKGLNE